MDLLITLGTILLCIILGVVILWLVAVIVVAIVLGVNALITRRRVIKRQAELRAKLKAQGTPFARMERRTAIHGLYAR